MEEDKNKNNNSLKIKRPIIFICNDLYAKGLRELRKRALIFNFRKIQNEKMIARLREICIKEHIMIDHETLLKIIQQNENDIRSCLNSLEIMMKNRNNKDKKDSNLGLKENSKSVMEIVEDLFVNSKTLDKNE